MLFQLLRRMIQQVKQNYRPINLLSAIPKVFEKIMFDQLYLAFSPIFSENMSGFLRGHSCCTALLKLTEDWRSALDDKKNSCCGSYRFIESF